MPSNIFLQLIKARLFRYTVFLRFQLEIYLISKCINLNKKENFIKMNKDIERTYLAKGIAEENSVVSNVSGVDKARVQLQLKTMILMIFFLLYFHNFLSLFMSFYPVL